MKIRKTPIDKIQPNDVILRADPDRTSIRRKIKRAGWDDTFLMQTLSHMR